MSTQPRPYASNLRHTLAGSSQSASGQSSALVARINEKKAELENLKQLRDLSAGLATQMESLEQKLSTLSNGTEGEIGNRSMIVELTLM
jgi:DASH complex subunit DAD2